LATSARLSASDQNLYLISITMIMKTRGIIMKKSGMSMKRSGKIKIERGHFS